jgi:exodeoxyribonuclease V beta subunit
VRAPLQLRYLAARDGAARAPIDNADALALVPALAAAEIVEFLGSGATVVENTPDGGARREVGVGPRHVAVLVRTRDQASDVQAALSARGVPSVVAGTGDVFQTDEAQALHRWLIALESPRSSSSARAAAALPLFGWEARHLERRDDDEDLDPEGEDRFTRWVERLLGWQREFERGGFMAAFRRMLEYRGPDADARDGGPEGAPQIVERMLGWPDGERRLTNLLHLAELLHDAQKRERLGLSALASWLAEERLESSVDEERRLLRLERDDDAVRIVTVHASKGLEYPIVWVPYLWRTREPKPVDKRVLRVSDPADPTRWILDLRVDEAAKSGHLERAERERRQEDLRLLYVAVTRAAHRCVLQFGAVDCGNAAYRHSSLTAGLLGADAGDPDGDRLAIGQALAEELDADRIRGVLAGLVGAAPTTSGVPTMALADSPPRASDATWAKPPAPKPKLEALAFTRGGFDLEWRACSYSNLTRPGGDAEDEAKKGGEVEPAARAGESPALDGAAAIAEAASGIVEAAADDDAPGVLETAAAGGEMAAIPSTEGAREGALAGFHTGPDAGDLLHKILEEVDFVVARSGGAAPAPLRKIVREQLALFGFSDEEWGDPVTRGIASALRAPLGPALGGKALCDFPREHRLSELRFRFALPGALGGPLEASATVRPRVRTAELIQAFRLARGRNTPMSDDYLVRGLVEAFRDRTLRGFFSGSIDLVLRDSSTATAPGRYFVIDYKSNRNPKPRRLPSPLAGYHEEWMRAELAHHHYFVQYHLYTVALHRLLSWRLGADYRYDEHVGGVLYLFLRGLDEKSGAERPTGVFFDRPLFDVVERLSEVLHPDGAGAPRRAEDATA